MCGIAGRLGAGRGPAVAEMVARLTHRGPDSDGLHSAGECSLGMRRLRVVDISALGDQPMLVPDRGIALVYNGELYNHHELRGELQQLGHRFRSHTDTEVVLHGYEEWGDEVVHRLRGMFAFAVWDEPLRRLVLARDRVGIKPLYVADEPDGGIRFASETQALRNPGRDHIDPLAVASFLRLGWVGAGATIRAGVREVPPGHVLTVQDGQQRLRAYWTPVWRDEQADVDRLRGRLVDSVARHLEADVPVGVFLSSGLDSTAVVGFAAETATDLRTFTVAFDRGPDETGPAAAFARAVGVQHEVVRVSGDSIIRAMPQIVAAMDQPTVDGVNTWAISQAVREAGMTVALSGVGGDELFSGYSTFRRVPQVSAAGSLAPYRSLSSVVGFVGRTPRLRHSRMRRAAEAAARGGRLSAYGGVRGLFAWDTLPALWPGGEPLLRSVTDATLLHGRDDSPVDELELSNYLRYQLLRDTDVMSMAHSLEVRLPLLDDQVLEAAMVRRPSPDGLRGKALLAAAAGTAVRDAVRGPKQTFTLPFDRWLRQELREWTDKRLDALGACDLDFDRRRLREVQAAFDSRHVGWRPLWSLAVLGAWIEHHGG